MIEHTGRFTLKLFAESALEGYPRKIVSVFHRWIQESRLPEELWVDVADYSHVHEGPGVILAGHAADLALDTGDGRLGLLLRRKRRETLELAAAVDRALETLGRAAELLSRETDLQFDTRRVQLTLLDRRHARNDTPTREALRTLLEALARSHGGEGPGGIEVPAGDPVTGFVRLGDLATRSG